MAAAAGKESLPGTTGESVLRGDSGGSGKAASPDQGQPPAAVDAGDRGNFKGSLARRERGPGGTDTGTEAMISKLKKVLSSIEYFSRLIVGLELRSYQVAPANALIDSCLHQGGLEFLLVFPRQSG